VSSIDPLIDVVLCDFIVENSYFEWTESIFVLCAVYGARINVTEMLRSEINDQNNGRISVSNQYFGEVECSQLKNALHVLYVKRSSPPRPNAFSDVICTFAAAGAPIRYQEESLHIHAATFGLTDVTSQVRSLVSSNQLNFTANTTTLSLLSLPSIALDHLTPQLRRSACCLARKPQLLFGVSSLWRQVLW
jgi:hypothetical protein